MSPRRHSRANSEAAAARLVLARHARSFNLAAKLLSAEDRDDAAICYALCREADDLVDEAGSVPEAEAGIAGLKAELRGQRPPRPLVTAFYHMALRRRVPVWAMWQLVDTIAEDAGPVRLKDDADLERYAFGVAGTVGLMMAGLLGGRGDAAERAAVALGTAMQITNVVRDVAEDARRDRVYLPESRLRAAGIDPEAVVLGTADPASLQRVTHALIARAEVLYCEGTAGLRHLPWRARVAIGVAAGLYRAIGHATVSAGARALIERTVLGRWGLFRAGLKGLWSALRPPRDREPCSDTFRPGNPWPIA